MSERAGAPADGEDGYDGPAELAVDGHEVPVDVRLRGHFDPISGRYAWYGRIAANRPVAELIAAGVRRVVLRTPYGEVVTLLSDVDPWGRPRVEGFGGAPFPVADSVEAVRGAAASTPDTRAE